jgi:hypothetical protein
VQGRRNSRERGTLWRKSRKGFLKYFLGGGLEEREESLEMERVGEMVEREAERSLD